MQNYFCAEGFPAEVPLSRGIVPNINRMARAMRAAGGTVVWVQTDSAEALARWGKHHTYMLTPERVQKRLAGLDSAAEGFRLFGDLEALPGDLRVKKVTYSAFMPGSSDIDAQHRLKRRPAPTVWRARAGARRAVNFTTHFNGGFCYVGGGGRRRIDGH